MAKKKCAFCNAKTGKRFCLIKEELICPVCCAKNRAKETCRTCKYFEQTKEFENKKTEKATSRIGSVFGSPQNQKMIMEASIDLMNNQGEIGKQLESDAEGTKNKSFNFYNSEEFEDFYFTYDEIDDIIAAQGEPGTEQSWFFSEEGEKYYSEAVNSVMSETKFKSFSQKLFKIFTKYYNKKDIDTSWLLLNTLNRLMEGDFETPFTILMFFRGLARFRKGIKE